MISIKNIPKSTVYKRRTITNQIFYLIHLEVYDVDSRIITFGTWFSKTRRVFFTFVTYIISWQGVITTFSLLGVMIVGIIREMCPYWHTFLICPPPLLTIQHLKSAATFIKLPVFSLILDKDYQKTPSNLPTQKQSYNLMANSGM